MKNIKNIAYVLLLLTGSSIYASEQINNKETNPNDNDKIIFTILDSVEKNDVKTIQNLLKQNELTDQQKYQLLLRAVYRSNNVDSKIKNSTLDVLIVPTTAAQTSAILYQAIKKQTLEEAQVTYGESSLQFGKGKSPWQHDVWPYIVNKITNKKNVADVLEAVIKDYRKGATAQIVVEIKKSDAAKNNTAVLTLLQGLSKSLKQEISNIEKDESEENHTGCTIS